MSFFNIDPADHTTKSLIRLGIPFQYDEAGFGLRTEPSTPPTRSTRTIFRSHSHKSTDVQEARSRETYVLEVLKFSRPVIPIQCSIDAGGCCSYNRPSALFSTGEM